MKFWEAALLVATLASVSAVKQQRRGARATTTVHFVSFEHEGHQFHAQGSRDLGGRGLARDQRASNSSRGVLSDHVETVTWSWSTCRNCECHCTSKYLLAK